MHRGTVGAQPVPDLVQPVDALLGVLFSGFFLPIPLAVLLYFLATNLGALGQHFLTARV